MMSDINAIIRKRRSATRRAVFGHLRRLDPAGHTTVDDGLHITANVLRRAISGRE